MPNVDIFYVYGIPNDADACKALSRWLGDNIPGVEDGGICRIDNVLVAGCADRINVQEDCILHKRLTAFEYLASEGRYDFIYTVCAASYVDQYELINHVSALKEVRLISGSVSIDRSHCAPFVSGASMLLSADIARDLGKRRAEIIEENQFGFRDDVAIGYWVAKHMSDMPLEVIMNSIKSGRPFPKDCIFARAGHTTVDYVLTSSEDLRPRRDAFHYHFHSGKAHDMAGFHSRYFLHQTRSLRSSYSDD